MKDYDNTEEENRFLSEEVYIEKIRQFNDINEQLKNLLSLKEKLTKEIMDLLNHNHEGQKTYDVGCWKLEVKTPCVYLFNKKFYESSNIKIPEQFNPIKESISYSIDKKLCEKYINEAPQEIKEQLILLIEKKPGKASITIKEKI